MHRLTFYLPRKWRVFPHTPSAVRSDRPCARDPNGRESLVDFAPPFLFRRPRPSPPGLHTPNWRGAVRKFDKRTARGEPHVCKVSASLRPPFIHKPGIPLWPRPLGPQACLKLSQEYKRQAARLLGYAFGQSSQAPAPIPHRHAGEGFGSGVAHPGKQPRFRLGFPITPARATPRSYRARVWARHSAHPSHHGRLNRWS